MEAHSIAVDTRKLVTFQRHHPLILLLAAYIETMPLGTCMYKFTPHLCICKYALASSPALCNEIRLPPPVDCTQLMIFGGLPFASAHDAYRLDVRVPSQLHSVGADRSIYTFDLKQERRIVGHQVFFTAAYSRCCML